MMSLTGVIFLYCYITSSSSFTINKLNGGRFCLEGKGTLQPLQYSDPPDPLYVKFVVPNISSSAIKQNAKVDEMEKVVTDLNVSLSTIGSFGNKTNKVRTVRTLVKVSEGIFKLIVLFDMTSLCSTVDFKLDVHTCNPGSNIFPLNEINVQRNFLRKFTNVPNITVYRREDELLQLKGLGAFENIKKFKCDHKLEIMVDTDGQGAMQNKELVSAPKEIDLKDLATDDKARLNIYKPKVKCAEIGNLNLKVVFYHYADGSKMEKSQPLEFPISNTLEKPPPKFKLLQSSEELVLENMGSADCYKVAHVVDTGVILYSINGQFSISKSVFCQDVFFEIKIGDEHPISFGDTLQFDMEYNSTIGKVVLKNRGVYDSCNQISLTLQCYTESMSKVFTRVETFRKLDNFTLSSEKYENHTCRITRPRSQYKSMDGTTRTTKGSKTSVIGVVFGTILGILLLLGIGALLVHKGEAIRSCCTCGKTGQVIPAHSAVTSDGGYYY